VKYDAMTGAAQASSTSSILSRPMRVRLLRLRQVGRRHAVHGEAQRDQAGLGVRGGGRMSWNQT
jgi:hypothetical protein